MEDLIAENERLTRALASRDAFLAVAAHELRNPMTPILGRVTLLRRAVARGGASAAEIAQGLERIEGLVTHFIKRATALLDVSRAATDPWPVAEDAVDVCELVEEVCERYRLTAKHAGASLDVVASPTGNVVAVGDRAALEQVLENLLSNAIKYGAGAPIRIATAAVRDQRVATITVQDDGPGILPEHHARIFDRYERAVAADNQVSGYGVGLWVVRNLCEAMGGAIEIVSAPGKGSTFSVSLPLLERMDGT